MLQMGKLKLKIKIKLTRAAVNHNARIMVPLFRAIEFSLLATYLETLNNI